MTDQILDSIANEQIEKIKKFPKTIILEACKNVKIGSTDRWLEPWETEKILDECIRLNKIFKER